MFSYNKISLIHSVTVYFVEIISKNHVVKTLPYHYFLEWQLSEKQQKTKLLKAMQLVKISEGILSHDFKKKKYRTENYHTNKVNVQPLVG